MDKNEKLKIPIITFNKIPLKSRIAVCKNRFCLRLILLIRKIISKKHSKLEEFIVKHLLYNGIRYAKIEFTYFWKNCVDRILHGMCFNEEVKTSIEAYHLWEKRVKDIVNSNYSCKYSAKALKEGTSDDPVFPIVDIIKKEDKIKFEPRIIDGKIVSIDIVRRD